MKNSKFMHCFLGVMITGLMICEGAYGTRRNEEEVNYARRDRMKEVYKKVRESLLIVQGDDCVGSGFVAVMDGGQKYFITNRHVVEGQSKIVATLLNGTVLAFGKFEVAKGRDLVRFALTKDCPALTLSDKEPCLGDDVFVFGNSDGKNVVTDLDGEVQGVGPQDIEISAKIVQGNSGGAVFNSEGKVIGVATYATRESRPEEWVKHDTRFSETRRFALRMKGVEWEKMSFASFYKRFIEQEEQKKKDLGILPQVKATFSNPKLYCMPRSWRDGGFDIRSDIALNMSTKLSVVKNPVVRVCVMIKGITGEYYVKDCIMDKTGSLGHVRECPPIYANGDSQDGWCYSIDNGLFVYYLEGLSYYQKQFPDKKKVGLRYYDKSEDAKEHRALFRVSEKVCGKKPPAIVCYRLECWQNGSLAGVYSSLSSSQLAAKHIPVDWYCRGRYPTRFNYECYDVRVGSGYSY